MRFAMVILALLSSVSLSAQDSDAGLRTELEALHAKWFKAFDWHDASTMNQIEMNNLVLVMPDGAVIALQDRPRSGISLKADPGIERSLSKVSVRRFGNTAILTGILTTKSAEENSQGATTVVFVESSGNWKIASAQWTTIKK
jgi:ketosteroid isomerase-like protein